MTVCSEVSGKPITRIIDRSRMAHFPTETTNSGEIPLGNFRTAET